MKRALSIQKEFEQVGTIQDLTSVFEAIASIHIAQVKDRVVSSTAFFNELWHIYSQLRVDDKEYTGTIARSKSGRRALVAVTSEGGLIGDIDEKILQAMMTEKIDDKTDVFMIGNHGSVLLNQRGIKPLQSFPLPDLEGNAVISPIVKMLHEYEFATVYYQTYISLLRQDVARINLFSAVARLGQEQLKDKASKDIISSRDYIFEPSLSDIIQYMESVMLEIALGQVILESKLAQYASRFNAMSQAKTRAKDMGAELHLDLSRARRSEGDERTKEILSTMKIREHAERV
jgi:F-type H+-transporting ATPase subunit gamma